MTIGKKLKDMRLRAGHTQEFLAEELGITRQTVSNWENGRSYPDVLSVMKVSELYGVSLDELLKGDEGMIEHIDSSTNAVKSHKRLIKLGLILLAALPVVYSVIASELHSASLSSGDAARGGFSLWPIRIDGFVVVTAALEGLIAALIAVCVRLFRLFKRKKSTGKLSVTKKDVIFLAALSLAAAAAFLILW